MGQTLTVEATAHSKVCVDSPWNKDSYHLIPQSFAVLQIWALKHISPTHLHFQAVELLLRLPSHWRQPLACPRQSMSSNCLRMPETLPSSFSCCQAKHITSICLTLQQVSWSGGKQHPTLWPWHKESLNITILFGNQPLKHLKFG